MATITRFPIFSHYRGEPNAFAVRFSHGRRSAVGEGRAFWFRPLVTAISEVPVDDRDVEFLIKGRSQDFQDVATSGVVTYRVTDAATLAERVDFSIDLRFGRWRGTPLEQIAGLITQLAQHHAADYVTRTPLRAILNDGVDEIRGRVLRGLTADHQLASMGLSIVAVRVAAVRPSADVEKALQTPTREQIQQDADEATFARRALAVEKERAIQENELATQIELARRNEQLVAQEGANERRRAEEAASAQRVSAEAAAEQALIAARAEATAVRERAAAEADRVRIVDGERVTQERARVAVYAEQGSSAVLALVIQEAIKNLPEIGQVNITPDMISAALSRLAADSPG
ncbi:MAG: SPFH domain-containing protein [Chloroflexota bacterium]